MRVINTKRKLMTKTDKTLKGKTSKKKLIEEIHSIIQDNVDCDGEVITWDSTFDEHLYKALDQYKFKELENGEIEELKTSEPNLLNHPETYVFMMDKINELVREVNKLKEKYERH